MSTSLDMTTQDDQQAWNEAHDRLHNFLSAFALGDHAQTSRLTLRILERTRELRSQNPSLNPTSLALIEAQNQMSEWIASNLEMQDQAPAQISASGYVALLLSGAYRAAPETFLTSPLPEDLKENIRKTFLTTGPDLNISSMTPRHLDYGPMLDLAKRTWHRWNAREILIAVLFWVGVYFVFYWWLSEAL